jgi:exonuclease VII small subunit
MKDAKHEQPTIPEAAPTDVATCLHQMQLLTARLEHALKTFQEGLDMMRRLLDGFADYFRPEN